MELGEDQRAGAAEMASAYLARGTFGAGFGPRQLMPQTPIPVRDPTGGLAAIFVPVSADGYLAGFFVLTPQLELQRYSTFCSGPDDIDRCPSLGSWTDPATITDTARGIDGFEPRDAPYLTYDGNSERLAWRVDGADGDDRPAAVFVTGSFAYRARPGAGGMIE
jgi:hypothetical protein